MQRIQPPESLTAAYVLGWRIQKGRLGFRYVGRTGGMPDVTTVLILYLAERVVIVVLSNKRNDAVVGLRRRSPPSDAPRVLAFALAIGAPESRP